MSINYGSAYALPLTVVLSQLPPSYVKDLLFKHDLPATQVAVEPTQVRIRYKVGELLFTAIWRPDDASVHYQWLQGSGRGRPISGDRWLIELRTALRAKPLQRPRKEEESFFLLHKNFPHLPVWEGCDLLPMTQDDDDSESFPSDVAF